MARCMKSNRSMHSYHVGGDVLNMNLGNGGQDWRVPLPLTMKGCSLTVLLKQGGDDFLLVEFFYGLLVGLLGVGLYRFRVLE